MTKHRSLNVIDYRHLLGCDIIGCYKRYTIRSLDLIKDDKTFRADTETIVSAHNSNNNNNNNTIIIRVATDLGRLENLEKSGNLKEAPESQGICLKSQGICDRNPKVMEKSGNFVV